MFDLDTFVADCRDALKETDPRAAVRVVLEETMSTAGDVSAALARDEGGINVVYNSPDLTVLNVIWAPRMTLMPHEHRMWAAIGIYGGAEQNVIFRRGPERIEAAGDRMLDTGDVFGLGRDAIHSVHNPRDRFTGAIHVYGGDFVNAPRSMWDPDTLIEEPYNFAKVRQQFAAANAEWRAQAGSDLDEATD